MNKKRTDITEHEIDVCLMSVVTDGECGGQDFELEGKRMSLRIYYSKLLTSTARLQGQHMKASRMLMMSCRVSI